MYKKKMWGSKLMILFVLANFTESLKLNIPRLLLPFNSGKPTNVLLEVSDLLSDECVDWISTAPYHVTVSPVRTSANHSCSKRAIVSAINSSPDRKVSYILVFKKGDSENSVACEVITDSVNSIEILYSTNDVFLSSPPELLIVIGRNEKGHTFTSLNGMELQWSMHSLLDTDKDETNEKFRIVTFADSSYESLWGINDWEMRGLHSSSILVEGLHVGEALIKAKLKNSVYINVDEAEVKINVKTNLCFNFCDNLYLLQNAKAHYKLETRKHGRNTDVQRQDYTITSLNLSVARFDEDNILTGLQTGSSVISAKYINGTSAVEVSSTIHVVDPSYMVLDIGYSNKKALEEIKNYEVSVKLFDSGHHQIYPSENLRIRVTFPNRLFYVIDSAPNGTYHVVRTIVPGTGEIRAELKGVKLLDGTLAKSKEGIKISQKITIYQAIQITPPYIMLPWDPISKLYYDIPVKASGGTRSYTWASSNSKSANVTYQIEKSKNAIVHVKNSGEIVITANDKNDSDIFSSMKISIQPVVEIEVLPTVVEAEIGRDIIIPVSLLGYEDKEKEIYRTFDDCSKIPVSVEVIDTDRIEYKEDAQVPPFGRGCLSLVFQCKLPGYSRVYIQCSASHLDGLKTTLVLACHKPIKPVSPVRVAVLAVGTSKEIVFEGGPRSWPIYQKGHYTDLIAESPNIVNIRIIKDPVRYNRDLHVFEVLCKSLGETNLRFHVGNKASPTNKNPAKLESIVKIVCGEPHSLHLTLAVKSKKNKNANSAEDTVIKVPFYGDRTFEINVWVRDSIGRKFANISSLDISWELSDYNLAKPRSHRDFTTHVDGSLGYRKVSRNFQAFEMTGNFGPLKVISKLQGYLKDVLEKQNISDPMQLKSITQSIDVKLISMRENLENLPILNEVKEMVHEGTCAGNSCPS